MCIEANYSLNLPLKLSPLTLQLSFSLSLSTFHIYLYNIYKSIYQSHLGSDCMVSSEQKKVSGNLFQPIFSDLIQSSEKLFSSFTLIK